MAPARKRKAAKKAARKTTRKTTKKAARKAPARTRKTTKAAKKSTRKAPARTRKTTKKAAKKGARKTTRKATKATAATNTNRPNNVPLKPRKSGTFSKTDLVEHVHAWNPHLAKKEVKHVVEDTLNVLSDAITAKKIEKVTITGFGSFRAKRIPAKKGGKLVKNPFTGEMVKSKPKPARMKINYRPAPAMKKI